MNISLYDNYSAAGRDFDFIPDGCVAGICDSLLVIVCLRGSAAFRLKSQNVEIHECNALIIAPDTPFSAISHTPDFRADAIRIGNELLSVASEDFMKAHLDMLMHEHRLNLLSRRKTRMFHIIHSYLKVLLHEHEDRYRNRIIYEYIRILFFEACHIMESERSASMHPLRERTLTEEFLRMAKENFMTDRRVEAYAVRLGVTSRHLSAAVKKVSGRHPSEWLEEYVVVKAKMMLRESDDTIQAISYDLNFATPSHFSHFFKSRTGMTPRKFRSGADSEQDR